jgi:outer membrane lipoprotein-sorting protein
MIQIHRFTKLAIVILLAAALGANQNVSANTTPQLLTGILAKMEKAHKDLKSLKAQIIQEKTNIQIGSKDKDSGILLYKPATGAGKGKFRLDYTKPANNTVTVVGDNFLFYQPKINQALKSTLAKAAKGRVGGYAPLLGLDGSLKGLLEKYNVEYIKDEVVDGQSASHLRLTPKVNGSFASVELWVNNQTWLPTMQKFNERNGDYTVVKLTNLQQNVALNDSEFDVKLPIGTKIVDKF